MLEAIRKTYDGPLDLAQDFMVWNVTSDTICTRMAVPNHDAFPAPVQRKKNPPDSAAEFPFSDVSLESIDTDSAAVTNQMIEEFNARNGTDVKSAYTGLPFKK